MGQSIYSHDLPPFATPQPAERVAAAGFLDLLRRDPPGASAGNRYLQSLKFKGVPYQAIRAIMDLAGGANYQVLKKKRRPRGKATFGPGNAVAKAMPGSPAEGRDEDYVPVDDDAHPVAKLVCRPNPTDTFGELVAKLVLQNRLTGVGPLWAVPNAQHKPVELWPLKTALAYPLYQMSRQYPNGAWRITPQSGGMWSAGLPYGLGVGAVLPGEEVERFMDPHPLLDFDGYSPLDGGAEQLDVLEAIDESRKSAMDNGLQLDAVLWVPGLLQEKADQIERRIRERAAGSKKARNFMIFSPDAGLGDKADLKTFGTSPRDMDYDKGWEQMVKYVLALFGVSAGVVGLSEAGGYSQLYAEIRQFHHRQASFFDRLGSWFTRVLCRPWESFRGEYKLNVRLPDADDPELKEQQLSLDAKSGAVTVNELRAARDRKPVEGGDVPPDVYLKWVEQKTMPQPQPAPGLPGVGGPPGADPAAGQPPPQLSGLSGGPTAGAVPSPPNPAAAGTGVPRPALAKAMSEACGSDGGFLVPPAKSKKLKRTKRFVRRVLKSL